MNWYKTAQSGIRLWLDDNRDPQDPKIQEMFGAKGDEIWVKTMEEAISYLHQGNVEFISFDHDLDNEGEKPIEHTGYDLASWIEERAFDQTLPPLGWNVHSRNPVGSSRIVDAMTNADRFWGVDGAKSE
jgi:hypothetical protein